MPSRRNLLAWGGLGLVGTLLPGRAEASVARAVTLNELLSASDHVLLGTLLAAESRWEEVSGGRRIVTYGRIRVDEPVRGAGAGEELVVRTLGGRVGKVGQVVSGEARLVHGKPAALFLTPRRDGVLGVTALAQGHYPVIPDRERVPRLRPSPGLAEVLPQPGSALAALVGQSQADALTLLRRAVQP